jgi:hypothetical protein
MQTLLGLASSIDPSIRVLSVRTRLMGLMPGNIQLQHRVAFIGA